MPTIARFVLIALVLSAATTVRSQSNDRYADWRRGEPASSEQVIEESAVLASESAEEPLHSSAAAPQPIEQLPNLHGAAETPAAQPLDDSAWEVPPATLRRLPFRFERAPAERKSPVIPASATEAVSPPRELSKPNDPRPMPLKPRQERSAGKKSRSGLPSATTLLGSVAVVVGLFLIVAWTARRAMPRQPPQLPREAIEVLGRQRFVGKQEVQLLRVGNKLVLVHVVPGHAETLTEITDPVEVDRLTGICYQAQPKSSSRSFHQTFEQFAHEKPLPKRASRETVDKLDLSMFDGLGRGKSNAV